MIYNNILFHNADQLIPTVNGVKLCRYKDDVRLKINKKGVMVANQVNGIELRFVTGANTVHLTFICKRSGAAKMLDNATATVYCGDYCHTVKEIPAGVFTTISLEKPQALFDMPEEFFKGNAFSKNVWRVHLSNGVFEFCGIDTFGAEVRPPYESEMPQKTILSYGSSISYGSSTVANTQSYVNTFARLMKMNVLTKGIGNSCHAEFVIADDFASRGDWDVALMEIGINMLGTYEFEEFEKRFTYLADKLYSTGKKIIFITIPRFRACFQPETINGQRIPEYNRIIREKCKEFDSNRVLIVDGMDIVKDTGYLMSEMVHPSTAGHADMGHNLYDLAKDFLK